LEEQNVSGVRVGQVLEHVPSIVAVVVGLAFSISVLFDWGFFAYLEFPLRALPTTLADHTRTPLLWTPVLLAVAMIGHAFNAAVDRDAFLKERKAEAARNEAAAGAQPGAPTVVTMLTPSEPAGSDARFRARFWWVAVAVTLGVVLLWVALGDHVDQLFLAVLPFLWVAYAVRSYTPEHMGLGAARTRRYVMVGLTVLAFGSYIAGNTSSRTALESALKGRITIEYVDADDKVQRGGVIRRFEAFALVSDTSGNIRVVDQDHIRGSDLRRRRVIGEACRLFGKFCPPGYQESVDEAKKGRPADQLQPPPEA
jgi:hypothetical protein